MTAAAVRPNRAQRKLDRRATILSAARRAFARRGYRQASIIEIARASDIAEGTIYKYFESKQDLLLQVMREFYEGLIADLETEALRFPSPRDRLRFIIQRQLQAFDRDRDLCLLFVRELRPASDYPGSPLQDLNRRYTSIFVRVLREGQAAGKIRPDLDPRLIRDLLYGTVEHIAWRCLNRDGRIDVEAATGQILTILVSGIFLPRRSSSRRST